MSGPEPWWIPAPWDVAIQDWGRHMRALGRPDTTIALRRLQLGRVARELPKGVGPWEVTDELLIDWLASKEWSSETRRSHRTTLRSFYRWATLFGHTRSDPTMRLPGIPASPGLPRPAGDRQIRLAMAGAERRVRQMILLGAVCGLRRAEIAKLHTADVTDEGIRVIGKAGRVRLVPCPPIVREALAGTPHGWVFASSRTPLRPLTPGYVGKLMSNQLGPGVAAHMLRHRFATVAYAAERDLFAVQTLMGHAKPQTTMIYTQVPRTAMETAVAAAAIL